MKTQKIIASCLLIIMGVVSCEKDTTSEDNAVNGCTDELALNYNSEATVDDGSCEYGPDAVLGCTDSNALNYNPLATVDDGSCIEIVEGCTDTLALNYNSSANVDDGSCEYGQNLVEGCTNELSPNYNPSADVDDGSCIYTVGMEAYGGIVAMTNFDGTSGLIVAASDYTQGQNFESPTSFGWTHSQAVTVCESVWIDGYNDWFVPSRDTLAMMYTFLHLEGYGDFRDENDETSCYVGSNTITDEWDNGYYDPEPTWTNEGIWWEVIEPWTYSESFNFNSGASCYRSPYNCISSSINGGEPLKNLRPVRFFP